MSDKPLFLWAHPRSLSTAMEVYFRSRGDFQVVHEPFGDTYWKGADAEQALESLLRLTKQSPHPVFVKDIAHHVPARITQAPEFLTSFRHLILVRQPLPAFHSHLKVNPQVKHHEFGYQRLYDVCLAIRQITGEAPGILLSEQLQENAPDIIEKLCAKIGIAHLPQALNWKPEAQADWKAAQQWQAKVSGSRGFEPAERKKYPPLPEHLKDIFEEHLQSYLKLVQLNSVIDQA